MRGMFGSMFGLVMMIEFMSVSTEGAFMTALNLCGGSVVGGVVGVVIGNFIDGVVEVEVGGLVGKIGMVVCMLLAWFIAMMLGNVVASKNKSSRVMIMISEVAVMVVAERGFEWMVRIVLALFPFLLKFMGFLLKVLGIAEPLPVVGFVSMVALLGFSVICLIGSVADRKSVV